jgi:predicted RecB family endonuclease
LTKRLKPKYDLLLKNVPLYSKRKRLVAEIDIIAYKEGICDIYEVKCSHRISKARRQLKKISKLISKRSKVRNSFFFCGESNLLVTV